jgi:hypothetical protein
MSFAKDLALGVSGVEIEAGRAWMGNAVYRDSIQASVMVDSDCLCLAVPNTYRFQSSGKQCVSKDYDNTRGVAGALPVCPSSPTALSAL